MIAILHLSDIHLKAKENPVVNRINKIVDSVKNELVECSDIIIVCSGDIAFSGSSEEYKIAKAFFQDLIKLLKAESSAWIRLIMVPGNHDCHFTHDSVRDLILAQAEKSATKIDSQIVSELCKVQEKYFEFSKQMGFWRRRTTCNTNSSMFSQYSVNVANHTIRLNCLNTSAFSKIHEQPSNLSFPIEMYGDSLSTDEEALTISIMHHPLHWMNINTHRELKNKLIEVSDLVLTGHEHVADSQLVERVGTSAKFIESGALQENNDSKASQFGLLKINFESSIVSHRVYRYESKAYRQINNEEIELGKIKTKRNKLEINPDYLSWLEEVGAPIAHPRKEEVLLTDLYVDPDVVIINQSEVSENDIEKEISSERLFEQGLCILIGSEGSGKTTFLKRIFLKKFQKGNIPISIQAKEIRKATYEALFKNVIKPAFHRQYCTSDDFNLDQIDRSKIVLLIDDFGNCALKLEQRTNLIENIRKWFGGVFLSARELLQFDFIKSGTALDDFTIARFLEFGHELRKEIISKWNALDLPYDENSSNYLAHKNMESLRIVNEITHKHFMEFYPLNILSLLQVHDLKTSSIDHGSVGFYYEYLIKHSLQRIVGAKGEASLYETFLREFCYFLFENRLNNLNLEDFKVFQSNFNEKKRISLSFDIVIQNLISSRIIRLFDEHVSLHQPYIYYYYTASALSEKMDNPEVKQKVERMLDRIYIKEFEGILMFLSHLESDRSFIVNALAQKCESYFKDQSEAELNEDIIQVEKAIESEFIPLIEASDEPESVEREISALQDYPELMDIEDDLDKEIQVEDDLNKFIRAVKTFELLGNVCRINYSWDYDVKKPLILSTYGLGLRLMKEYFDIVTSGADGIVDHAKSICSKKNIESLSEIQNFTKRFTMYLTYMGAYSIIKRISSCLGHKQLRTIFQEISTEKFTNARKLIEFSIDLHQLGIYPDSEIKKHLSETKGFSRPMARLLLRNFVYEYTELYKIDVKKRQKIFAAANINLKEQRKTQATSKKIK